MSFILIPALKISYPKPFGGPFTIPVPPGTFSSSPDFSDDFEEDGWPS